MSVNGVLTLKTEGLATAPVFVQKGLLTQELVIRNLSVRIRKTWEGTKLYSRGTPRDRGQLT